MRIGVHMCAGILAAWIGGAINLQHVGLLDPEVQTWQCHKLHHGDSNFDLKETAVRLNTCGCIKQARTHSPLL